MIIVLIYLIKTQFKNYSFHKKYRCDIRILKSNDNNLTIGRYHYTYKIKNGEKVKFYGSEEIMKEFNVIYYGDGGALYYRK
jgi:hypothetical protein